MRSIISENSSTSHTPKEETQGLLELVNMFVKANGGHFTLTVSPASCEVRYMHASGIGTAIVDSFAAPSDMVVDVMNRTKHVFNEINKVQGEEMLKDIPATGGIN